MSWSNSENILLVYMKTITVKELKAHWATVESEVRLGETFEVLNRGRVAAHIVPARPRPVVAWPDHLSTALQNDGTKGADIVVSHRRGRH